MAEQLADRHVLAGVVPVVIDDALEEGAGGIIIVGPFGKRVLLQQLLGGDRIKEKKNEARHRLPGVPHLGERWRACRLAVADEFIESGQGSLSLQARQPVTLLLPRQVANVPANEVHRQQTTARIAIAQSFEGALEFAASKTQLKYQRVWHVSPLFHQVLR